MYLMPFCLIRHEQHVLIANRLVFRATGVLYKPLDELSSLLGFDIPNAPEIDLAGIKSDGAILHWSRLEKLKHKSSLKYAIYLNGVVIGTVTSNESAVTITGLLPGSYYIARVALMNHHDFSSKSKPIRFRTKPASSGDCFISIPQDGNETDADAVHESVARIRPFRGLKDITPASHTSTPMTRSGSSGLEPRRSINGRRLSPGAVGLNDKHDPHLDDNEAPEGSETIQQLTKKLDEIRSKTDEAERQAKEEEEEEQRVKDELLKERDELRAELNEKDKASKTLKREVNTADRQNTQAQNERSKQKRLLDAKKEERQKLQDDIVKWDQETETMNADALRLRKEKETYLEQAAKEKEHLRARLAEEASKVRDIDEQVKEKTSEIKRIERAPKEGSPGGTEAEPNLVQQYQQDAEDERTHQNIMTGLQQQYALVFTKHDAAKRFYTEQMRWLETLRAERRRHEEMQAQYASPPQTQERLPRRENSQRSRNAVSRQSVSDSPRLAPLPTVPGPFVHHPNPSAAAYLNFSSGMTIAGPTNEVSMSEEERSQITGGAAMSPGIAADLIPRDLFSNDDRNIAEHVQPLPGLGTLPGLAARGVPLPPSASQDNQGTDPASPGSASSRSPSVFASPRASQNNLNLNLGSPSHLMDTDRQSIRSTRSNRAPSGSTTSRFSGMFGIKQRNKTMSEEGPPLSKANSMPRADQMIPGLGSMARKRNSSISGTVFQGPSVDGSSDAPSNVPGRRAFGWLSRDKSGGWPSSFTGTFGRRPTSPRPGSTHSIELPRPSMDSTRWGVGPDASAGARNSPLAFGPGWNVPQQSRFHGSRHPSRRQSLQYGASAPPEDILEDDDSDALDPDQAPHLAPIGTKPPPGSKKADTAAKLNPNAKDFKSFFKFGSSKDKSKDRSASRDNSDLSTQVPSSATTPVEEEESPPNSRKSRDVYSLTTTESPHAESGRPSSDLARTPSYSNSDVQSPSLAGNSKETFMQKITRKSSSGKFALPTFKRNQSHLNPAATSAPFVPEQDEEDDMSTSVGSLKDSSQLGSAKGSAEMRDSKDGGSKDGSKSSRSWSSVLKIGGKKKGNETPSLSGISISTSATEEADEEGEEDEVGVQTQ